MKNFTIGIDVSPLYSAHKVRGIGFYTERLVNSLKNIKDGPEIVELKNKKDVESEIYDLLHIPYFSPFIVSLPLKNKVPLAVTVHDLIAVKYPNMYPPGLKGMAKWFIQKNLLKKASIIFADSLASKKDIVEIIGISEDKIIVTLLAADSCFIKLEKSSSLLHKTMEKFSLPNKFVLYVGDINRNKNIPSLIKACGIVDCDLAIVGKQASSDDFDRNHPENSDLIELQAKAEASDKVSLLGYLSTEELVAVYNLATVYCQPSIDEGFGLPILEAMACGCPVVSSNLGSLSEVVGKAGVLVNPTPENLAREIDRLFSSSKMRDELSKKGISRAGEFSWQKTAIKTAEGYRKTLGL